MRVGWTVDVFGTGSLLLCQDSLSPDRNRAATSVTVGGGKTLAACYQEYYPPEDPDRIAKNIAFEVASLGPGDKIVGSVNWTGPNWAETEALAKQILGTLRLSLTPSPAPVRPDCPADWNVYEDPSGGYSFCFPTEMDVKTTSTTPPVAPSDVELPPEATGATPAEPFQTAVLVQAPWDPNSLCNWDRGCVTLNVGGHLQKSIEVYGPDPDACPDPLGMVKNRARVTVTVAAGKTLEGCYWEGYAEGRPETPAARIIFFEMVRLAPGDMIVGSINWTGPDWVETEALAKQILSTLVIR
jgi:hypothetical protein